MLAVDLRRRLALNMLTCTRCATAKLGPCANGSVCLCPEDQQPLHEHAQAGACPIKKLITDRQGLAKVVHGAVGIAKAVTGTGGASKELIAQRLAICAPCEHAVTVAGIFRKCSICGCATAAKVRNVDERCPDKRW